jgi:hypothetical protein
VNKLSELTTRGTERSLANVVKAASISLSLAAFRIQISRPKARAASLSSFVSTSLAALLGFTNRAMTPVAGARHDAPLTGAFVASRDPSGAVSNSVAPKLTY